MCLVFSPSTQCSSNGYCVNSSTTETICNCTAPGFSSLGDWRFQSGLDCDVYIPAVLAIWCLVLVFATLALLLSTFELFRRGYRNITNHALSKVHLSLMAVEVGWLITSIYRVSDINNTPIGVDVAITYIATFSFLITSAAALYILLLFYSIHASLLKAPPRIKIFRRLCFVFFFHFLSSTFSWLMGIIRSYSICFSLGGLFHLFIYRELELFGFVNDWVHSSLKRN